MAEIRPPRFRDDTPERMAARMIAMETLGAWNPVPDDKLLRLLAASDQLRGVVGYAPLADSIFDAVLAVLACRTLATVHASELIHPLLTIWGQALQQFEDVALPAAPPPPPTRAELRGEAEPGAPLPMLRGRVREVGDASR